MGLKIDLEGAPGMIEAMADARAKVMLAVAQATGYKVMGSSFVEEPLIVVPQDTYDRMTRLAVKGALDGKSG